MNKITQAIISFIDEKFAPLEGRLKVGIAIVIVLLPAVAFYFLFLDGKIKEEKRQRSIAVKLEKELVTLKKKVAKLDEIEEQYEAMQARFLKSAQLLPKEQEIPQLLKDISSLGRNSGLDFNTFKPLSEVSKDFYAEIPVSIDVRGPYHNVGLFFDQVSKLERIVSVTNVRMGAPKKEEGEMLLKADCKLVTYRFTDKELQKTAEK